MTYRIIQFEELELKVHHYWLKATPLLTCGDFKAEHYNTMTVGWGSMGTIWNKPFIQVFVRPTRYTFEFMEQYDNFTVCLLPAEYKPALTLLGTKSGRDGDKIKEAGLSPIASLMVGSPAFAEADLIVECKKIYWQDLDSSHFLDPTVDFKSYPKKDYHRVYFGEMVAILAK